MKTLFKILLSVVVLLVLSGIGGYFYMKQKFAPPANQLTIAGLPATGLLHWTADTTAKPAVQHTALLVPVRLPNCARTFYLQFDTGVPYTVLYAHQIEVLRTHYTALSTALQASHDTVHNFRFGLGGAQVTMRRTTVLAQGRPELPADSLEPYIIGTLGTDVLDGRVLVLDYSRNQFTLAAQVPDSLARRTEFAPLAFTNRRLLLDAGLQGKTQQLLFDSGSSGNALITSQDTWKQMATPGAPARTTVANSWGKKLLVHKAPTAAQLRFGTTEVPLRTVTYIEGMNLMQQTLMRFSGLAGMLGNEPFAGRMLVLDVKGGRYGVLQP
ncbi:hypothetical protein [Hymenobacter sediminicola]|uniref:Aspartyl protease family protein n=1 Tax=Hymenobacter sediminicola TaxID=2761579 RepID=A0A7G7W2G6_9BACT|nr:hypothetical protein [Hymenobacter sediminicola]QNH60559.1 hypothetical protein H4317_10120 [Hymenobacter sediminicola]